MSENPLYGGPFTPKHQWHFLSRLYERYGIVLTKQEVETIREELVLGKHLIRMKDPSGGKCHHYYVPIKGKFVAVVFNAEKGAFITAKPNNRVIKKNHAAQNTPKGVNLKEHRSFSKVRKERPKMRYGEEFGDEE